MKTILGYPLSYWKERKCSEDNCYNFCERGYVYCTRHLRDISGSLPEIVIRALKKEKEGRGQ